MKAIITVALMSFAFLRYTLSIKVAIISDVTASIYKKTLWKKIGKYNPPPGGLEPPTFRLTAERASQLRHGGFLIPQDVVFSLK